MYEQIGPDAQEDQEHHASRLRHLISPSIARRPCHLLDRFHHLFPSISPSPCCGRIPEVLGCCLQEIKGLLKVELRLLLQHQRQGPGDMSRRLAGPAAVSIASAPAGGENPYTVAMEPPGASPHPLPAQIGYSPPPDCNSLWPLRQWSRGSGQGTDGRSEGSQPAWATVHSDVPPRLPHLRPSLVRSPVVARGFRGGHHDHSFRHRGVCSLSSGRYLPRSRRLILASRIAGAHRPIACP